ncbi:MAG: hypothetical protein FGM32_04760 [Candidatus Kapabacteria bacterium]|nr:hypothetical protein [Candidatus Kapabacteria bacterium]
MTSPRYARLISGLVFILLLTVNAVGQQNFFNVPSSDITERTKVFFQQQFNLFSNSCTSNSTFCYGVGQGTEIGVNVLGVSYDFAQRTMVASPKDEQPVYPSFGLNAQKLFELSDVYALSVGAQLLFPRQAHRYEWYAYLNNRVELHRLKLILGLYGGNDNYFDSEPRFSGSNRSLGVQAGIEYELIADRIYLQADYLTGRTALSNLIVGGAIKVTQSLFLSAGYQLPNNVQTSAKGLVLEITFVE